MSSWEEKKKILGDIRSSNESFSSQNNQKSGSWWEQKKQNAASNVSIIPDDYESRVNSFNSRIDAFNRNSQSYINSYNTLVGQDKYSDKFQDNARKANMSGTRLQVELDSMRKYLEDNPLMMQDDNFQKFYDETSKLISDTKTGIGDYEKLWQDYANGYINEDLGITNVMTGADGKGYDMNDEDAWEAYLQSYQDAEAQAKQDRKDVRKSTGFTDWLGSWYGNSTTSPTQGSLDLIEAREGFREAQQARVDAEANIEYLRGNKALAEKYAPAYAWYAEEPLSGKTKEQIYQEALKKYEDASNAYSSAFAKAQSDDMYYAGFATDDLSASVITPNKNINGEDVVAAAAAKDRAEAELHVAEEARFKGLPIHEGDPGYDPKILESGRTKTIGLYAIADRASEDVGSTITLGDMSAGYAMLTAVQAMKAIDKESITLDPERVSEDEYNTWLYLLGSKDYGIAYADEYALAVNDNRARQQRLERQEAVARWFTEDLGSSDLATAREFWRGVVGTVYGAVAPAFTGVFDYTYNAVEYAATGDIREKSYLTPMQAGTIATSAIADTLNRRYGTIDDDVAVLGGKGLGDLYQVGESILQSWASIAAGGEVGSLAMFFFSAGAQGIYDALDRGIDPGKAITLGTLNGLAEVAGEVISVEGLVNNFFTPSHVEHLFLNVLKQAGYEGSEEVLTSLLNGMADEIVNRDKSDLKIAMQQYLSTGMSYDEASKQATKDFINSIASDALSGALSGFAPGAIGAVKNVSYRAAQRAAYGNAQAFDSAGTIEEAKSLGDAKLEAQAKKAESRGSMTNRQQARIERRAEKVAEKQNTQNRITAIENRLKELGETEDVHDIAVAIDKNSRGVRLNDRDIYVTRDTKNFVPVLKEISEGAPWTKGIKQRDLYSERYERAVNLAGTKDDPLVNNFGVDNKNATIDLNGSPATLVGLELGENDNVEAVFRMADGIRRNVQLEDAVKALPKELGDFVHLLGGKGAQAPGLFENYQNGQSVGFYLYGMENVGNVLARAGVSKELITGTPDAPSRFSAMYDKLTPAQIDYAYKTGSEAREAAVKAAKAMKSGKRNGTVSFDGGEIDGVKYKAVDASKRKGADIDYVSRIAKTLGVDVVFFQSEADNIGFLKGANGAYKNGVIYLDINAGMKKEAVGERMLLTTLAHELTHYFQDQMPEQYEELKKYISEYLLQTDGVSFNNLVASKMSRDTSGTLTKAGAIDEVIADACETMLRDSSAMEQLAQENPELHKSLLDFIRDFLRKILDKITGVHAEAKVLEQNKDVYDTVQRMWDAMFVASAQQTQTETEQKKAPARKETEGNAQKADRDYNPIREKLAKEGLDRLSVLLGDHFPLSANFDRTIRSDFTPLNTYNVLAGSANWNNESRFQAGKRIYEQTYGAGKKIIHLSSIGIDANLTFDVVRESLSKGTDFDAQSRLDIIPNLKEMLESGVLLGIERVHVDNRHVPLYGYRIYNAFNYNTVDQNGFPIVERRILVATVVQSLDNAHTYVFRDIDSTVISNGSTINGSSEGANNGAIDNISQLYQTVKQIPRNDGGLLYTGSQTVDMLFPYTERNDGTKYSSRDLDNAYDVYNNRAVVSEETLQQWLKDYAADNPKYAQAYIAYMSPRQFLRMTTYDIAERQRIERQSEAMTADESQNRARKEPIFLRVDVESGEINGHEGRHRMVALDRAGVTKVPVLFFDSSNKYSKTELPEATFMSQFSTDLATVSNLQPLSRGNIDNVRSMFSEKTSMEKMGEKYGGRKTAQFAMRDEVEETDKLVAVHNKSLSGLRRMLNRNGVPFPSIAIKKAGAPHEGFGDVSIVFPKSTIDPQSSKWNKLYSNDAWTPTEPRVEHDVGDTSRYKKQFMDLMGKDMYSALKAGSYLEERYFADRIDANEGDVALAMKDNPAFKYAYLKSIGQEPEAGTREKSLDGFGKYKNDQLLALFDAIDGDTIKSATWDDVEVAQRIADILNQHFLDSLPSEKMEKLKKRFETSPLYSADDINVGIIKDAYRTYESDGLTVQREVDNYALERSLRENKEIESDKNYLRWIADTFADAIVDTGIPNGKGIYTDSGNRRSFKARHVPATLENIVEQMRKEKETGVGVLNTVNLRGAATKSYSSVEDMRAESGKLLGTHVLDDVYDSYMREFHDRLNSLTNYDETAEQIFLEAIRDAKTKSGMDSYLRKNSRWINYSSDLTDSLWQLKLDVQNMPAPYFEAKPRRVVSPDEALAYIIPDNADADLVSDLENRGYNVLLYKAGDSADRLEKLNSVKGAAFSERETDTSDLTKAELEAREMTYNQLKAENAMLKRTVDRLKKQTKLTKENTVRQADANKLAKETINRFGSQMDPAELAKVIKQMGDYLVQTDGADIDYELLRYMANDAARKVLDINKEIDNGMEGTRKELGDYLKGQKLFLPKEYFADMGDISDFRKRYKGVIRLAQDGLAVDVAYQELTDMLGEGFFPSDISNPADQLQRIADVWDSVQATYGNPFQKDLARMTEELTQDILWDVISPELRQTAPTYADKAKAREAKIRSDAAQKLQEIKEKDRTRLEELRTEKNERIEQLKKQASARLQAAVAKEKAKKYEKITAVREHYKKKEASVRDNRKKSEIKAKIFKTVDRLDSLYNRGTKEKNVKIGLQGLVSAMLDSANALTNEYMSNEDMVRAGIKTDLTSSEKSALDAYSKLLSDIGKAQENLEQASSEMAPNAASYADKIDSLRRKISAVEKTLSSVFERERNRIYGLGIDESVRKVAAKYKALENSEYDYAQNAYDEGVFNRLSALSESTSGTLIRDMSVSQLQELLDAYTMIAHTVSTANKLFGIEKARTVEEAGEASMREVRSVGGNRKYISNARKVLTNLGYKDLKPVYFFDMVGSDTMNELFNSVRGAEDKAALIIDEARRYRAEQVSRFGADAWDMDKQYTFESAAGNEFQLTLGTMMSLYAYFKRDQAAYHLEHGGFVLDDSIEITEKKRGIPVKYSVNTKDAFRILANTTAEIFDNLSSEQKAYVDAMQQFMVNELADYGNEVTRALYGINGFKDPNYFPIKSSKQFVYEQNMPAGEHKIKNSGFTKDVVPYASNPIVLQDFDTVWAQHCYNMAMYAAFTLPVENMNRVVNYHTAQYKLNDTEESRSVKATIASAYGEAANEYIKQFLTDVNGGAFASKSAGFMNKLIGKFKKSATLASASVVVQQYSSVARAMAVIDPKYFTGKSTNNGSSLSEKWETIKKYAPVAIIKDMGYFDNGMGRTAQEYILTREYRGLEAKAKAFITDSDFRDEVLGKGPELMDQLGWVTIWNAAYRQTKANNPNLSEEELNRETAKLFNEAIVKTQVYDSVISRSEYMRSTDTAVKMATSFLAEPTTTINMLFSSVLHARRGDKAKAARVTGAVITSLIFNAALQAIVFAARDDDDDKTYAEKYLASVSSSLIDNLNVLNMLPYIRDIMSIVEGYSVERSDMSIVEDLIKGVKVLGNDKKTPWEKFYSFVGSVCNLFGIPLKNIMRDGKAVYNTIDGIAHGEEGTFAGAKYAIREGITGKATSDDEQLYQAYLDGDEKQFARVSGRYENEKKIKSALKKVLKQHFLAGDITEEEANQYLVDAGVFDDDDDAYWTVKEWTNSAEEESWSKYKTLYDATLSGNSVAYKSALEELVSHGENEKDIMSALKKQIHKWYVGDDNGTRSIKSRPKCEEILKKFAGLSEKDARDQVSEWNTEVSAPEKIPYDDIGEEFIAGNITAYRASEMRQRYGGQSKQAADAQVLKWQCEKDTGIAYDEIREAFETGKITAERAIAMRQKYGGETEKDALSKVMGWKYSEWDTNGNGSITQAEAFDHLKNLPDSEADAIWSKFGWSTSWEKYKSKNS